MNAHVLTPSTLGCLSSSRSKQARGAGASNQSSPPACYGPDFGHSASGVAGCGLLPRVVGWAATAALVLAAAVPTARAQEPPDEPAPLVGIQRLADSPEGVAKAANCGEVAITLPGGVPLELVCIPAGTFLMGSPVTERERNSANEDLHEVTLSQNYYLGKYEVTQEQWKAVTGSPMATPCGSYGIGSTYPVYCRSWNKVAGVGGFLEQLNTYLGSSAFRLPTDAEWERAARADNQYRFSHGDVLSCGDACETCTLHSQHMWWCRNASSGPRQVGQKLPNAYGLYDMHGNVAEWVQDWFKDHLGTSAVVDPIWPSGSERTYRSGYWDSNASDARSAFRYKKPPGELNPMLGFRVAITANDVPLPQPDFTWSPTSPAVGEQVQLTDTSTGSPTSWAWTFGDGQTSTAQHPVHTYSLSGDKTVTLTVTNAYGSGLATKHIIVPSPCSPPPVPGLVAPASAPSGEPYLVAWDATSPDDAYELQEAAGPGFAAAQSYPVGGASRSFNHTVTRAKTYYYRIRARVDCEGQTYWSGWSATASTTVVPPATWQAAEYSYDNLNRLTSATVRGSRIEYQYDAAGNLTRVHTPYSITVAKGGTGTGTVTDVQGKVDCGDDCTGVYDLGASVTLQAAPDPGMAFAGWAGACGGDPCVVNVGSAVTVAASFVFEGADLAITNSDGLASAAPGETVTYLVAARNHGPALVPTAAVADAFPAQATCTWTSVAGGGAAGSAGAGSGNLTETLNLPAGSAVTYTAACVVDPGATGTLTNTATVSSPVPDPNPGNESAVDTTLLAAAADLRLEASASATGVAPGATIGYTFLVGNLGPSPAASLLVLAALPNGTTFVSAAGTGWLCNRIGATVACSRPSLAPSDQTEILVTVQAPSTPGLLMSSGSVTCSTFEAAPGDESDTVEVEVFGPPTIVAVGSVAATEAGELLPGTTTAAAITQVYLEASHELDDPGGNTAPYDATNPACYRLFQAAPDGSFGSTTCFDPPDVPLLGASYGEAGPHTVALSLSTGRGLTAGWYRLLACGNGDNHLRDAYGSPLDGDADGSGGDSFSLDFEVQVSNLLVNPNLDQLLDGWTVTEQWPGEVTADPLVDASEAPTSGAARLTNLGGAGSVLALSQCVAATGGEAYVVGGKVRATSSGPSDPSVTAYFVSYDGPACGGLPLGTEVAGTLTGDTAGLWVEPWQSALPAAEGTASLRIWFEVSGDEVAVETWLDDLQLFHLQGLIFSDGFEGGDSTAWSGTAGK